MRIYSFSSPNTNDFKFYRLYYYYYYYYYRKQGFVYLSEFSITHSRFLPDYSGMNTWISSVLLSFEECELSHIVWFPGWFLLLSSLKSLNFLWHGSQCSYRNWNSFCFRSPHILAISAFCPLLWLPGVFLRRYGYFNQFTTLFGIMSQDDIRLVGWHSPISVELLFVQFLARTYCRNRAWTIPWLVYSFHIHDEYSE